MPLVVQSLLPPPSSVDWRLFMPPSRGAPAALTQDPYAWASAEFERRVFRPIFGATTAASIEKRVASALPAFCEILDTVTAAVPQPSPPVGPDLSAWRGRARAYVEKAHELADATYEMAQQAGAHGVLSVPPYRRRALFDAHARLLLLLSAAGQRRGPERRLSAQPAAHLAFLAWQAAMRFHGYILPLVPEEVRERVLARMDPRTAAGERLQQLLSEIPPDVARKYRTLVGRTVPTEADIDSIVREACEQGRR